MSFLLSDPLSVADYGSVFSSAVLDLADDVPPNIRSEQVRVVGLASGTAPAINFHTISRPFTITFELPKQFAVLGNPNPVTGLYGQVPNNVFVLRTRKAVQIASGQYRIAICETRYIIPAGAEAYDSGNVRAAVLAHNAAGQDNADTLCSTVVDGSL